MGDMESYKVMLNGPAPWGFRLQGGKDFSMPLSISRLTLGGKAAQAGVGVGDWVLYIDGESTSAMTHIEAQNRIRACGDRLCLTLSRAQNQLGKPQKVLSLDKQPPQLLEPPSTPVCDPVKLRMLEDIDDSKPPSWTSQSRSFRKLSRLVGADAMEDGEDELVKKPRDAHGSSWGTEEQWQPLEPPSTPGCDPGKLRMLEDAEDWQPRTGTSQSRSFRKLAQLTGTDGMEDGEDEFIKKPRDAHGSNWGTGQHRQPPQALEPPSDTVCDPVKLRMLEDIVDSKPHTWTSQSRSFRKLARLVGANSMDDGEDEPVKKPRDSHGSIWGIVEQREPLEPPSTPGCDPGKLRLMEDAEGWQPRTGTSQSRSFRRLAQLTGTDEMEDGEDQIVKKPRDAHGSSWGTVEQRQPPQPLEPPSTPGCSPGKLRLMEDAEDWQPRTGTSQSRTFRRLAQLTGTDSSSEFPQGLALPGRAGLSLGCQSLAESGVALECWFWPRVVPVGWLSQGSWWGCAWSRAGDTGLGFWSALWLGRALFWGRVWWEERLVFLFSPLSPLVVPGPLSVRTDCFLLSLLLRSVEDHDDVFVRKPRSPCRTRPQEQR
ncbi:PDZ and LIM domain protein 7 isoform X6 [Molothrus ater]|uniref:PDZ and LIM domain protein 7 isoform X6 n=1 Tax=Molothrus ater TaxID=84834 RepID=UPI0023E88782|nr:PDZ and LIM domain protein 7 isoform X6 [Molothrus ater]